MTAPVTTASPQSAALPVDPDQAPLPSLDRIYGPEYPEPGNPTKAVAYVKSLIAQTNTQAHLLARNAAKNACYANGKMWVAWDSRKREYRELPLEEGEFRRSLNLIRPILRARTQRLLSSPVDFLIVPDSNALAERDQAKVGVNFLRARYKLGGLYGKLDTALEYAFYAGVAALKSFWNRNIGPLQDATLQVPEMKIGPDGLPVPGPDGQPATELVEKPITVEPGTGAIRFAEPGETAARYRLGDTDTAIRTIFQIRLNPEATGWTPAEGCRWLLDVDEVPLSQAKSRYPALADQLGTSSEAKPTQAAERTAASAVIKNPATDFLGAQAGTSAPARQEPMILIAEYWELPCPYFRGGRCLTVVGDQVAYDGPFPDGVFPYDPVYDEPAPGWWPGRASVNDMIDPSDVINRQWTAIDQEMWEQGIGQFISLDLPGIPNQLGREARQVIKIPLRAATQNRGVGDVFRRLEHQGVPPDRWKMIQQAQQALYDVGGFHEVSRGSTPPGVDSGVAIEHLIEQEHGQSQKSVHALEQTIISWARKQLAIARKYYEGATRWIPVDRPDMGYMVEGITGLDLPDPDQCTIELENFKPRSGAAFQAQITDLMAKQLIPSDKGLRLLDLGRGVDGAFASQTRHYAKARQENLWIEKGIASFQEVGQQPVTAQVADPVTGQMRDMPTGVMEPVYKVVVPEGAGEVKEPGQPEPPPMTPTDPTQDPEAPMGRSPETGQPWVPLLLPLDDDHVAHMEVLDEIILDVTRPFQTRQLALAHKQEHREALSQQMAQNAPPPAPSPTP